jgi:hypothetical protein
VVNPYREPPDEADAWKRYRNPGGTKGGLGEFLVGLGLLIAGGYLFLDRVTVSASPWAGFGGFGGTSSFGLMLLPLFLGIAILFFNGKSVLGWLLAGGGIVTIFVGVIASLHIWFRPTSLWATLFMLGMMAAGLGLIARALRDHSA